MNTNDLIDAIGEADDTVVERAKQKKQRSWGHIWIAAGTAAACLVLVLAIPVIRRELVPDRTEEDYHHLLESHEAAVESAADIVEIAPEEYMEFDIWYVDSDHLACMCMELEAMPENKFLAWKELNGIGEDVRFISVKIEDNSWDSVSDGLVTHYCGDYFIYNLTVSKELEAYYDTTDKALLLESLEKTMKGNYDFEFDEYHLILE